MHILYVAIFMHNSKTLDLVGHFLQEVASRTPATTSHASITEHVFGSLDSSVEALKMTRPLSFERYLRPKKTFTALIHNETQGLEGYTLMYNKLSIYVDTKGHAHLELQKGGFSIA